MEATIEAEQVLAFLQQKGVVRVHYAKDSPDTFSLWGLCPETGNVKCLDLSKGSSEYQYHKGGSTLTPGAFSVMIKGKTVSYMIKPGRMVQHSVSSW